MRYLFLGHSNVCVNGPDCIFENKGCCQKKLIHTQCGIYASAENVLKNLE